MTTGSEIRAVDLKTIQDKAESLLGTGSITRGYGQTVLSADYAQGTEIRKAHWDALRYDIVNIRTHQDGVPPTIIPVKDGDVITYGSGSPNTNYDTLLETAIANRFNIGAGQGIISTIDTKTYTSSWATKAEATITATFANSDQARYFFNSGGKIRVTTTRTGGTAIPQNNAWTNILSTAGTREFGAATDPFINFYTLTDLYQIFYQVSSSTPYSANNYRLEARCNVPSNSGGTATVVYIRVSLNDAYVDNYPASPPPDLVDGTLSIVFNELKAFGTTVPSGTFTVTSPVYSVSSITAS